MSPGDVFTAGTLEAQLVANAGDAFIVADAEGVIRFWNPAAEKMFGYSSDEAIGSNLDIIVPDPQRAAHWNGYHKTMATGQTKYAGRTLSVPAMRADGTRLSVSFTVSLLFAPDGSVAGIGAVMRDVTTEWEQKRNTRRRLAQLESDLKTLRDGEAALQDASDADARTNKAQAMPQQRKTTDSTARHNARIASAVIFVTDLSRSVLFYRDVFACEMAVQDSDAALLLTPDGFQIYLRAIGASGQHSLGGVGVQSLMWATDSEEVLRRLEQGLRRHSCYVDTHTRNGVSFAEGHDPDGIRMVIAHPSPEQLPRQSLDARVYGW